MLTSKQKHFLFFRNLKEGSVVLLPQMGFSVWAEPNFLSKTEWVNTNPFTKSLNGSPVVVQEIVNQFVKVKFIDNKTPNLDFYLLKTDLEIRAMVEIIFLSFFCVLAFFIYNLFKKDEKNEK